MEKSTLARQYDLSLLSEKDRAIYKLNYFFLTGRKAPDAVTIVGSYQPDIDYYDDVTITDDQAVNQRYRDVIVSYSTDFGDIEQSIPDTIWIDEAMKEAILEDLELNDIFNEKPRQKKLPFFEPIVNPKVPKAPTKGQPGSNDQLRRVFQNQMFLLVALEEQLARQGVWNKDEALTRLVGEGGSYHQNDVLTDISQDFLQGLNEKPLVL